MPIWKSIPNPPKGSTDMKMKKARILMTMIGLGAAFACELSRGEQATGTSNARKHDAESRKKADNGVKQAAGPYDGEPEMSPKAIGKKREIQPGRPRLKLPSPLPAHAAAKKQHEEHAPAVAGPGSGVALAQKPKAPPLAAKSTVEIPKTEGRPKETASAAGSAAVNGTLISALRHGGANLASVGGITPSTARGAGAVNGTQIKAKH